MSLPRDSRADPPILTQAELEMLEASRPVHREPFAFPSKLGVPGWRRAVASVDSPLMADASGALPPFSTAYCLWITRFVRFAGDGRRLGKNGVRRLCDVPADVRRRKAFDTTIVALLLAAGATGVVPVSCVKKKLLQNAEPWHWRKVPRRLRPACAVLARMASPSCRSYPQQLSVWKIVGLSEHSFSDFFEMPQILPGQTSLERPARLITGRCTRRRSWRRSKTG